MHETHKNAFENTYSVFLRSLCQSKRCKATVEYQPRATHECVFTYAPIHFQIEDFSERSRDDHTNVHHFYYPYCTLGCCGSSCYEHDTEVLSHLCTLKFVQMIQLRIPYQHDTIPNTLFSRDIHEIFIFICALQIPMQIRFYSGRMHRISHLMAFQSRAILTTFGIMCSFDFGLLPGEVLAALPLYHLSAPTILRKLKECFHTFYFRVLRVHRPIAIYTPAS